MTILLSDIIAHASRVFGVDERDIKGPARVGSIVRARYAVCKLAYEKTPRSYPEIGKMLGGRDHSTIIHGHKECIARMRRDPVYAAMVRRVWKMAKRGAWIRRRRADKMDGFWLLEPWEIFSASLDEKKPSKPAEPEKPVLVSITAARTAREIRDLGRKMRKMEAQIEELRWAELAKKDDCDLLSEAVRDYKARGGCFVEVWG